MKNNKPWKMKIIDSLGLKPYMIRKYIFRPPPLCKKTLKIAYSFEIKNNKYNFVPSYQGKPAKMNPQIDVSSHMLRGTQLTCPIILLQKNDKEKRGFDQQDLFYDEDDNSNYGIQQSFGVRTKCLIIYSHGNASDLSDVYFYGAKLVQEYNVDFIGYDYTGYGISKGFRKPSEQQTYDDLLNVLSFAVNILGYQLSSIILWGFSLGSGPTVEIAQRFKSLAGIILQAPLASLYTWFDSKCQTKDEEDMYQNINKIQNIKCKILLIHGIKDKIINIKHSELLLEKYINSNPNNNSIWLIKIDERDHNNLQDVITNGSGQIGVFLYKFLKLCVKEPLFDEFDNKILSDLNTKEDLPMQGYGNLIHSRTVIKNKEKKINMCICGKD